MSILDRAKETAGALVGKGVETAGALVGKAMDTAGSLVDTARDKLDRHDPSSDSPAVVVTEPPRTDDSSTGSLTDETTEPSGTASRGGQDEEAVTPADVAEAVNNPDLPHPEPTSGDSAP